ncbi:hypothetical protein [Kineosporia babensis]|uniref:Uncharacterized protein n=1 Tax=Kineosporia babensis TaxID=499548 RepID=A0A9X1NJJ2_9ACTN|nr:hypothetical protein [Kineosporia babensis]MCD5314881.1 hypothetical protein [Kineosporia babensis]
MGSMSGNLRYADWVMLLLAEHEPNTTKETFCPKATVGDCPIKLVGGMNVSHRLVAEAATIELGC